MDPRSGSEAGSSAGVRRLATVLLVVLVAFVAWWGWTEWNGRDSDQSPMEVTREVTRQETPAHASDDGPQDGTQVGTHDGPHEGLPVVAVGDAAVTEVDGSGLLPPEAASQGASVPGDSVRAVTTSGAEELAGPGTEEGTAEAEAEASADAPPAPSAGEMPLPAALTSPVGGGWSLHPWSFADSTDADRALETLVRLGMQPEVRSASIDGRTWYRVLVGSFPSRAEAWQQRERLASMVETDWVGVVRVTP